MKVYFAHPISSYGSGQEKQIVLALQAMGLTVVNPNDQEHQDKVKEIQEKFSDRNEASRLVMEYFISICRPCDGCIILPFPDGSLGAGIVKEVRSFMDQGKKVQEVRIDNGYASLHDVTSLSEYKCLDVDSTRAMLKKLKPSYGLSK